MADTHGTAKKGDGGDAVALHTNRMVGIAPDGRPVNNVQASNRYEVSASHPHLRIALKSEDLSETLFEVYIPNTREMPDVVLFEGFVYEVYDTRLDPPTYKQCMVATAYSTIDGENDATTE